MSSNHFNDSGSARRKLRKLIRDPNLFFYDYFKKRLEVTDEEAEPERLPRDYITDLTPLYARLVEALVAKTCPIQEMPGRYRHERRLAVKRSDIEHTLAVIRDEDLGRYRLLIDRPQSPDALIEIWFTDGRREYRNPTILIDPWRRRGNLVQSQNFNPFSSTIMIEHVDKTVCSPAPLYLAGEDSHDLAFDRRLGFEATFTHHFTQPLDVVYTWVDSADPAWRGKKEDWLHRANGELHPLSAAEARYRSRDELRYSLRSVRSFLKDARKIYLVTDAQVPGWLDAEHPAIEVVDHSEIFPDRACLPTFNSHAIEANLHRIPGLSEHFVYFNDDVLLLNPCNPLDFFHANGIGKSFFEPLGHLHGEPSTDFPAFKNAALRGARLLRQRYGKTAHTYHEHVVHAFRRSVIEQMWDDFPEPLEQTSHARFRGEDDISALSFFYHYYAIQNGWSVPSTIPAAYVPLGRPGSGRLLEQLLNDHETKVICINDLPGVDAAAEAAIRAFFRAAYAVPAEWELDR